jgi:hypothetical protein
LFDLIGQRIASYEEYSHMIEALKQLVGDMEKVSFIAHDLNPRLIYFMETKEKESPLLNEVIQLLKHSLFLQFSFV